jgi:hypothetical protein
MAAPTLASINIHTPGYMKEWIGLQLNIELKTKSPNAALGIDMAIGTYSIDSNLALPPSFQREAAQEACLIARNLAKGYSTQNLDLDTVYEIRDQFIDILDDMFKKRSQVHMTAIGALNLFAVYDTVDSDYSDVILNVSRLVMMPYQYHDMCFKRPEAKGTLHEYILAEYDRLRTVLNNSLKDSVKDVEIIFKTEHRAASMVVFNSPSPHLSTLLREMDTKTINSDESFVLRYTSEGGLCAKNMETLLSDAFVNI